MSALLTEARRSGDRGSGVYDAVAGLAPPQRQLDDPQVEEVWINERLSHGFRPAR